ncbi:MAG: beta-lactamase family protein [Hahellaceae bacterium]|nr:beta-lactamase family protein [Hahellaceae bacterium]
MKKTLHKVLNASNIVDDVDSVTQIRADLEVDPAEVGLKQENIDAIWESTKALYRTGTHPGMQLCVRKQGKIIINRAIGHAHGNGPKDKPDTQKVAMTTETPVCLFSASKAVTALLIHMLAEDNQINLLDPVSYYCPEFAQNGKKNITIHHILSHRGGIPGLPTDVPLETLWNSDEIWRLLCEAKPISADGAQLAYHALTGGYVLQRVLEQVTGESIQAYLNKTINEPLGLKNFTYGMPKEKLGDLATNYVTGPTPPFPISWIIKRALGADVATIEKVTNDPRFQEAVIPAGNLTGTAEEVSRFFQMMLNGGTWEGKQVCDPMTIHRSIQEYGTMQIDRTMMIPMRYSAGMMLGGDPVGMWGPNSAGAFGHIGLINKLCWADERRDISVSLLNTGIPFVAHHYPNLIMFVNAVCKNCPPTEQVARTSQGFKPAWSAKM